MQLSINQSLDGNLVKRLVSDSGAYGLIYEVENSGHKSPIALKLLKDEGNQDLKKRFFQENQILRTLNPHKRIITSLSDTVDNNPYIYYLLELADTSLYSHKLQSSTLDIQEVKSIMLGICEGLQHAHSKNISHRDLYWNNVLLKNDAGTNDVKITDFGLAKDFNIQNFSNIPNRVWGCLFIQPPEYQFRIWDNSSPENYFLGDIYALGILLFFLFHALPTAHMHRVQGEILTLLLNKNIDLDVNPEKEREVAYSEWLTASGQNFFTGLQINIPDLDIMNKVNTLIRKLSDPDYSKRPTDFNVIMSEIKAI